MPVQSRTEQSIGELERIGLSPYEARAYLTLLANQPVNGYDLARLSGIPSSKIYETLKRLVSKGVALSSASVPIVYRALPPDELIAGIRRQTERSLEFLEGVLPGLAVKPSSGMVWRLNDRAAILDRLREMVLNALGEVFLSVWPAESGALTDPVKRARERGVRFWVATFGKSDFGGEGVYDLLSCGVSSAARLGKRLTAAAVDDRLALIAEFRDDGESSGAFAEDPSLALVTREYIVHDLVNHALISELGTDRFSAMRVEHPLVSCLLGPGILGDTGS